MAAPLTTDTSISFIIPVLNDRDALATLLPQLQRYREKGHEVLIVDGGSNDGSVTAAREQVDRILITGTGRGRQMNLGAENARHGILNFLHADSIVPEEYDACIQAALKNPRHHWGRFDVTLDEPGFIFRIIGFMMNLRSRCSGVATGDQGIFVRKDFFDEAGGFKSIPLMEDIALSKALRKKSWPVCIKTRITTSAKRWKTRGVVSTIWLMWVLRLKYFLGVNPERLAEKYYPAREDSLS